MRNKMLKRMLCGLLAWVLVLGYIPVPAHAAQTTGLCPHHTQHTPECGYTPGVAGSPCAHVCDAGCYQTVTQCTHVHGDCGYVEGAAESVCTHVCSVESGCVVVIPNCQHVHDDSCGYVAEIPESPCTYQCAECQQAAVDQAAAAAVAAVIAELPTVEELRAMTVEEQTAVYNRLQAALNAYNALTIAQKALIPEAETVLLPLLEYFDSLGSTGNQETGSAADVEAVQALIDGLPTLEEVQTMSMEEQLEAYNQVQSAYGAYDALPDDQKAQISNAEETFAPLFEYFNSLTDLTATHSHPVCGAVGCSHGHSSYSWTAWDGTSSISGTRFYLTQDVTRTTEYYISGTVWICLNGHTINTGDNASGLTVNPGATLIITDCQGSGMIISGSGMSGIENNGSFVLWNGTISGEDMGIFSYDGSVTIRGGSVTASTGDGIQLSSSSVTVENGSVYGYFCGITNNDSDCTIKVTGGSVSSAYSSISCIEDAVVDICGGAFTGGISADKIFLSGSPEVDVIASRAAVSLHDSTGSTAYIGAGFRLRSSVGNGNVAVTKVPDAGIADKITVYDGVNTGLLAGKLVASGTDLILYTPVASGQVGNLQWLLYGDGDFFLTGTGAMPDYSSASGAPWYSYRNSIRRLFVSEGVTGIGSNAFRGSGLQSVSFGSASLSLGDYSFAYCESLTDIDFGSGTISPGSYVFQSCTALTSVHVPANVVMNGSYSGAGSGKEMFNWCTKLQTATVDCSYVGPYFFEGNTAMTQATFTDPNVQFYYLEDGNSGHPFNAGVNPMNVTVVGHLCSKANVLVQQSQGRSNLTLTFSQIDGDTTQHTEQIVPGTATCTQDGLSEGKICSTCGLVLVAQQPVSASHQFVDGVCSVCGAIGGTCGENLTWVLTDDGVLTISGSGAMANYSFNESSPWNVYCNSITSVTIDSGVTSIGDFAFYGCSGLTSVTIPKEITSIGKSAFDGCSGLTSVTIPEGVTSIKSGTFAGCSSLTSVTIPKGVTSIEDSAFSGCASLTSVTIPEGVTSIGYYAFYGCFSLTSMTIPEGVTSIESYIFSDCSGLTSVTIPEGVTSIGSNAFHNCWSLTSVTIPKAVTSIGSGAFSGCSSLASVTIPEGVASIGSSTFYSCTALETVTIPASVKTISNQAFNGCSALTDVYYGSNKLAWDQISISTGNDPLLSATIHYTDLCTNGHTEETIPGKAATCTETGLTDGVKCSVCGEILEEQQVIPASHQFVDGVCSVCGAIGGECGANGNNLTYVLTTDGVLTISGSGGMADYSQNSLAPWYSEYTRITTVVLTDGVTSIGRYAFYGCSSLTSVTIPKGVTFIGWSAFESCSSLTSITIPDGVTSIEYGTFYGCSSLTSVAIPDSVTSIGNSAFRGCSGLTFVTIPEGVTSIGGSAFNGCSGLTSITIPDGVTSIGNGAFYGCSGLTSVTIPEGVTSIGGNAFYFCSDLTTVQFLGDGFTGRNDIFSSAVTAYYPHGNTTWTQEIRDSFGSRVTWVEACTAGMTHTEVIDEAKSPTCTETGLTEGSHCSVCGETLTAQEEIPAKGHTEETIPGKTATCTEDGLTDGVKCSVCGEILTAQEEIPATGHTEETIPGKAATCTETGLTDGVKCSVCGEILTAQEEIPATGHTEETIPGKAATCTETGLTDGVKCSVCGEILTAQEEIPAKGHTEETIPGKATTCTETGLTEGVKCSVCGEILTAQEEIPAKGHTEETIPGKTATCTEDGLTDGVKCSVCGEILTAQEEIPAKGHTEVIDAAVAPTCTETGLTEGKHCSVCNEVLVAQEVISAKGHTEETIPGYAATCTEDGLTDGKKCSVCGEILTAQEEIPAKGHTEETIPGKAATCTETGLTEGVKCSVCGEILTAQEEIPAKGHTEETIPGKAATCTGTGLTDGVKCSVCGEILTAQEEIPAKGHTEETIPGYAATCTEDGLTEGKKCSVCGEILTAQEEIPATGHTEETIPGKAATCTETGLTDGVKCSVCGETLTAQEEIPATGHTEETIPGKAATCTETGLTDGVKCAVCGEILTAQEVVSAKGHTEVIDAAVAPTCTETGLTEGKHCSVCNEVLVAQEVVSAKGHTEVIDAAVAPTCTETGLTEGKHCSVCNEVLVAQEVISAKGHTEETIPGKAATCTETGLTDGVKCSVCGKILTAQTVISRKDHTEEIDPAVEATCTEPGLTEGKHCSVCGVTLVGQYSVPAKGHTGVIDEAVEATCTETGLTEGKHCSVCDKILVEQKEVPAKGHTEVVDEAVEATCTETGLTEGKHCSVCDEVLTAQEETPALDHDWGEWTVSIPATPEAEGEEIRACSRCEEEETRPLPYTGSRLELAGTGLENESVVWIDGAPCYIQRDETGKPYLILPENCMPILVTYSFNTGSGDRHAQYPTGMQVYRIVTTESGMTVEHIPALDNLLQYSGSSIRITGKKGIRMITSINQATRNALTGEGLAGFTLLEYGTALCRSSVLEGGAPLVLETAGVKSNYAYLKDVADPVFKYTGGLIQYTNVLVGFSDEDCKEDIAMRPYIKLQDESGEVVTIYGGTVYRSIGYIAYQNRNAFKPGSEAYNYVWNIIRYVYGDQYDADYKG